MSKKIKDLSIYGGTSLGWLEDAEEVEKEELLLKDLCARLPYGVKGYAENVDLNGTIGGLSLNSIFLLELHDWWDIEFIKPYLRPMSSMTEEEKKEYGKVCELDTEILANHPMNGEPFPALYNSQDWLNVHHFDYRGLIEKGLALEAPKEMYKEWISTRGNLKEDKEGNIVGGLKL